MKFLKIIIFALIIIIIVSPFFLLPRIIKIEKITCMSQYGPCGEDLQLKLSDLKGLTLKETNRKIRNILDDNVIIEEYLSQYKFPQSVSINLIITKTLYALKNKDEDKVVLIDSGGVVVSKANTSNLPTLITPADLPATGKKVDEQILFALDVLYDMKSSYQVNEGVIIDGYLSLDLESGQKVLFPLTGDREVLIGSLSLILSRLNRKEEESRIEEIQEIKIIDLRFKNPILK